MVPPSDTVFAPPAPLTVIDVTGIAFTAIPRVPVTPEPSLAVAVTVTVPIPVPVNIPVVGLIVAVPVPGETLHVTVLSVASAGNTAALI